MPLNITPAGFSFLDENIGGWTNLSFSYKGEVLQSGQVQDNSLCFEKDQLKHEISFEEDAQSKSLIVTRKLVNLGSSNIKIAEFGDGLLSPEAKVGVEGQHEYNIAYLHTDNARTEQYPDSRPEYPYLRQIPYETVTLGRGEANALPALVICDLNTDTMLIEGDLDQRQFLRSWTLGMNGIGEKAWNDPIRHYQAHQSQPLGHELELEPGQSITLSTVFYQLLKGLKPYQATEGYFKTLNDRYELYGKNSPMLNGAVFCTWNYGTLYNINEALIEKRAKAVAEKVPGCTHFLIDDGFQENRNQRNGPLDCFYPKPAERYDREKFPSGMKAMAEKISATGLVPAIWFNPTVYLDSPLAKEHPEWLLCDRHGNSGLIGNKCTYLDLSVPEAREFFLETLDALFVDWGYRGIKFDFMTQWFTLESAQFKEHNGLYWRDFVFSEIRKRIGSDGLFMTCIAMSMGNPFVATHADVYRCGCDIHDGTWSEQVRACRMTLPQILLEGRSNNLLNMDSAGFGDVPRNEQLFRLTWVYITQGIIELGGPVEELDDEKLQLWQVLLRHCDRGHQVQCLDERALTGDGLPQVLKVSYPKGSRMAQAGVKAHIAFFNWQDHGQPLGADRQHLGIQAEDQLISLWENEKEINNDQAISFFLEGHSAKLIEIR